MNRQQAFGGGAPLLKGALHCHTTRSDGDGTPEEVLRLYAENGYDFVALTDHNLYNYTHYAPELPLTVLPGMERDHRLSTEGIHCYHTVCIGPSREAGNGYAQDDRFEWGKLVKDDREYQAVLDDIHAHGNLTMYCHPEWSGTPAREFMNLSGNFAMELWNTGCAVEHDLDNHAAYWDELLLLGKRIWGTATDDGHKMSHHAHGWVRVRAENDIGSILSSLRDGAFYASCGPEIVDFYVDGDLAVLECSPAAYIGFRNGKRPTQLTRSESCDLTRAEIRIPPYYSYVRGVVKDAQGRMAWTNPIFL